MIDWCNQGISLDKIKAEIENCESSDNLKLIYGKYPNLSKELYPIVMTRKAAIDNVSAQLIYDEEIINNLNPQENEPSIK